MRIFNSTLIVYLLRFLVAILFDNISNQVNHYFQQNCLNITINALRHKDKSIKTFRFFGNHGNLIVAHHVPYAMVNNMNEVQLMSK